MALTGLGDRAQLFAAQRHNVTIRERLATLNQEMSTGVAADLTAHLGGDTAPLADIDRRLALTDGYARAAREAGDRLGAMQVALGNADALRSSLAATLVTTTGLGSGLGADAVASAGSNARGAFDDLVGSLNARFGEGALFAGTAVEPQALAGADAMMASIRAAVAGLATAADVVTALDTWFNDPAGGFATMGYQGNATLATRGIDQGSAVTLGATASDPGLKGLLKAAAAAALASDPALGLPVGEGVALLERSRDALHGLASPLTRVRADLGLAEARVEEAVARHAARKTAFGIMRTEMVAADPFETASALEAVQSQLETHYTLTNRLQGLSLVNYLT